jgi:hypothetical protein
VRDDSPLAKPSDGIDSAKPAVAEMPVDSAITTVAADWGKKT